MQEAKELLARLERILATEAARADAERRAVAAELQEARELRARIAQAQRISDGPRVALNVGGSRFSAAASTLAADPRSLLAGLAATHAAAEVEPGKELFLDRDAKHFARVLQFLRDGSAVLAGLSRTELLELRAEALYYRLAGLVGQVNAALPSVSSSSSSALPSSATKTLEAVSALVASGALRVAQPAAAAAGGGAALLWKCEDAALRFDGSARKLTRTAAGVFRLVFSPLCTFDSGGHVLGVDISVESAGPCSVGVVTAECLAAMAAETAALAETATIAAERPAPATQKRIGEREGQWGVCEDGRFYTEGTGFDTDLQPWVPGTVQHMSVRIDVDLGVAAFTVGGATWSATVPRSSKLSLAVIASPHCTYTLTQL